METRYLNNTGDKWIIVGPDGRRDPELMRVHVIESDGTARVRAVDYWAAFGNFAAAAFRRQGRRITRLPEDCERSPEGLAVIRLGAGIERP